MTMRENASVNSILMENCVETAEKISTIIPVVKV